MSAEREALTEDSGREIFTFIRGTRDGLPLADLVEVPSGSRPAAVVDAALAEFPGWAFSAHPDLGRLLLDRGATPLRHAHWLARDLTADPPDPDWADLEAADPDLQVGPASLEPLDYLEAAEAAYPVDHPDYEETANQAERIERDIAPLLDGTYGPLLAASGLVRGPRADVVAACLVTDLQPEGPWVVDVFRRPEPAYAGLGSLLLRRMLALLAEEGWPRANLTVTEGNPAWRTYTQLGFQPVRESLTVRLPGAGVGS